MPLLEEVNLIYGRAFIWVIRQPQSDLLDLGTVEERT